MAISTLARMMAATKLQAYKLEYNVSGQLDFLLAMRARTEFAGKAVLEVGGSNIPKGFVLDELGASQWLAVDRVYPANREYWPKQYAEGIVLPLDGTLDYEVLGRHVILNGRIEDLPESFFEKFDLVVSLDAFEHIHKFASMLDRVYDALKPGGMLLSMNSPIWSCHFGHHLWGVVDKQGRTFSMQESPIPAWGHLLMRPWEMYSFLRGHTDAETADQIVYEVYYSENLNRLFAEDYTAYVEASRFERYSIGSHCPLVPPDPATQIELERLHPGMREFSTVGIDLTCHKRPGDHGVDRGARAVPFMGAFSGHGSGFGGYARRLFQSVARR